VLPSVESSGWIFCTDGGIARKVDWYADRRPVADRCQTVNRSVIVMCSQQALSVVVLPSGSAQLRQSVACSGSSERLAGWLQLGWDWTVALSTVPNDTRCQYCANWHSLSVLYHLTLAVSTVPVDTRCQYCANWHSLSILYHLTLAVSTVPVDTRCQYCANWHSLSVLYHLTLAVSTVPSVIDKLTSSAQTRTSHWQAWPYCVSFILHQSIYVYLHCSSSCTNSCTVNVICTAVKLGRQQLRNFVVVPPAGRFAADPQSGRFLLSTLSVDSSKSSGRREQAVWPALWSFDRQKCDQQSAAADSNCQLLSALRYWQLLIATVSCCLPYGIGSCC